MYVHNYICIYICTIVESDCSCDLYVQSCDLECCCDSDCSENEVEVFSQCINDVDRFEQNVLYIHQPPFSSIPSSSSSFYFSSPSSLIPVSLPSSSIPSPSSSSSSSFSSSSSPSSLALIQDSVLGLILYSVHHFHILCLQNYFVSILIIILEEWNSHLLM